MFFSALIVTIKMCIMLFVGTMIFAQLVNKEDAEWIKRKPLALMCLFYAAGALGHNVWVAYIVMIAAVPMMCKDRGEAAGLFVVALGAMPDLTTGLKIGSASILGIDKWVCLSLGLTWVLLSRPRVGLVSDARYDAPFLIMLALEFAQGRDMNFTSTFRSLLSTALAIGLPYYALVISIGRVQDLRRVMMSLVYIGFMLAFVGVCEAITHVLYYQLLFGYLNIGGIPYYRMLKFRAGLLRTMTSFSDATAFAQFLVIALTATMASRESFRSTGKMVVALGVIALGIFVTSTRNAWIGAILCVLGFDLFRRRYTALAGKLTVLGMGYAVILLLAEVVPYFATMMGKSEDTAGTADYRSRLLTRGIEEFWRHPLGGVGGGQLLVDMQDMVQGEGIVDFVNGYLYYSLISGVFALIGLALVFLLPCWAMLQTRRPMSVQGPFLQRTTAFVFAVCFSFFVTTAFTGFGGRASTYLYVTLGIGAVIFPWRRVAPALLAASDRERRTRSGALEPAALPEPPPETPKPRRSRRRTRI